MKSNSFFWESDGLTDNPLIYHRPCYLVIVCILGSLLQLPMQLQTIALLLCSTTQGRVTFFVVDLFHLTFDVSF